MARPYCIERNVFKIFLYLFYRIDPFWDCAYAIKKLRCNNLKKNTIKLYKYICAIYPGGQAATIDYKALTIEIRCIKSLFIIGILLDINLK